MRDLSMIYKLVLKFLTIPLLLIMAHNKLNKKIINNADAIAIATNGSILINSMEEETLSQAIAVLAVENGTSIDNTLKNFNETEIVREGVEELNKTAKIKLKSLGTNIKTTITKETNNVFTSMTTDPENFTTSVILTTSTVPSQPLNLSFSTTTTTMRGYLGTQSNAITKFQKNKTETRPTFSKPQKTDAPMLNYIFDSFSTANKHHHHDQRYGPHFEDIIITGNVTNITIQAGTTIFLNCRISLLQDKTVSWVKRKPGNNNENSLELLTVGMHTYSGDNRYTMEFQYPNNWRLKINTPIKSDEGTYECQVSTHPPRVIQINLYVNAPEVMIVDEFGVPLQEKYYEIDSTLQLFCIIRNVVMSSSVVLWSHGDQILNYDTTRGGVSVKTELMENGANSTLSIAKINKSDSGIYTCSIDTSHEYNITVHILNGESFAELHHGNSNPLIHTDLQIFLLLIVVLVQYKFLFLIR